MAPVLMSCSVPTSPSPISVPIMEQGREQELRKQQSSECDLDFGLDH